MNKNKNYTYISLFSSGGVGCFGFKKEKFDCIATNEILTKRINIQKINKKCKFDSGYINGDITKDETKNLIFKELEKWQISDLDVIVATPPCQGMSVANLRKKETDLNRNSLVIESIDIVKRIKPKFFIFENVPAFWKTGCSLNNEIVSIGNAITQKLSKNYFIEHKILNFKEYGSNSSRKRTLVIGMRKNLNIEQSILTSLFPKKQKEKTLYEVIGNMKELNWGEFDQNDFYHSFRTYDKKMLEWIKDLKEGESAFDNEDDYKKPHKIINGKIVVNKRKVSNKYTRQVFSKVAPCILTRNDTLSCTSTIHPKQNRVFSIRELMKMMTIPDDFKWIDKDLKELNLLSIKEKQTLSKKEELNIRKCIGESVPTIIFQQIAQNIKKVLSDYDK